MGLTRAHAQYNAYEAICCKCGQTVKVGEGITFTSGIAKHGNFIKKLVKHKDGCTYENGKA